ncbi:hypothetical protein CVT26_002411 [Gymnopilus dilepis]|uniref:Reverse transcriptase domain-containing protein n=1 Tax=Gymnopilus dilepis TaxID=231916 RepID=A0A409Y3E5_9AGAR|nr:hypothetical protein CVT26_002411 [Gymnopilus dilepis]
MPTQWGGPPPARPTPAPSTPNPLPTPTAGNRGEIPSSSGTLSSLADPMSDAEYEESPMAALQTDFHEDREEPSVASRASMLAEKKELAPDDVYDFGEGDENRYTRYALKVKLMDIVQNTVTDVDFSMRKMAGQIPGRKTHFKVDPDDVIIAALSGSQSLPQLHGAWTVLTKRMAAALKFADKYEKEFRERKLLTSPGSTPDVLHDDLQKIEDGQTKLKYMLTNFPRHNEDLTPDQRLSLTERDDWEVLDTPNWMKNLLDEPEPEEGQRSIDVRPVTPPNGPTRPTNELGLQETSDDDRAVLPRDRAQQRQKGRVSFGSPGPLIVHTARTPQEGLLGSGTPFKSQSGFLRGFDGERAPRFPPVRGAAEASSDTPNPLFGMATPGLALGLQDSQRAEDSQIPETPSQPPRTTSWMSYQFSHERQENPNPSSSKGLPPVPPPTPTNARAAKRTQPSQSSTESPSTPSSPSVPPSNPFGGSGGGPGGGGGGGNPGYGGGHGGGRGGGGGGFPGGPPIGGGGGFPGGPPAPNPTGPQQGGNFAVPTIKAELKLDQLPSWDGNHETAIEYFWKIQQLAALRGQIPEALGFWLWHNLKEGSTVQIWFATLPPVHQDYMRTNWLTWLNGIKEGYLGRTWQLRMNKKYESQSFRQFGHEGETPAAFIVRRIMYTRMLVRGDYGGRTEVYLVMQRAPISWGPVINLDSIRDSGTLYAKVTEHERALIYASSVERNQSHLITSDNLAFSLRKLGVNIASRPDRKPNDSSRNKFAHFTQSLEEDVKESSDWLDTSKEGDEPASINSSEDSILKEAYQVLKQRQRPPPKGGYPFPKNDHVKTKLGKLPPSPCKCCGSSNHWDKECPDWNTYLETRKQSANIALSWDTEEEGESRYSSAYSILLNEQIAEQMNATDSNTPTPDFLEAATVALKQALSVVTRSRKTGKRGVDDPHQPSVRIEEIEDEDDVRAKMKRKCESEAILEEVEDVQERESLNAEQNTIENRESEVKHERIRIPKAKRTEPGQSALGVSVVSMRGRVGSTRNPEIDLRLDSCADVTLISEEFYNSLKDKAPIRKGTKMYLWQLTDKDSEIKGYVRIPILVQESEKRTLEFEAEAYVVPQMTVPILLGEDFQLTYEILVERSVANGTTIHFKGTPYSIPGSPVERTSDFDRLRQSAYQTASFIKGKLHRKRKNKKKEKRKRAENEATTVRAAEDTKLRPDECKKVRVMGQFDNERTWFFERDIIISSADSLLVAPNLLFNASEPFIPISNTSTRPRMIRKGDVLGYVKDPEDYFDRPRSEEERENLQDRSKAYAEIIRQQTALATSTTVTTPESPAEETSGQFSSTNEESEEPDGPKTAALPDLTVYPSSEFEKILDIGDLPDDLRSKALDMLRKHEKAFGFDGRLGHYPGKVQIRTKDNQKPIALPMYGTSPAKRKVIDEQLDKWFEQDVIEPSNSPWGAPVVIAYRNGKPRFCVDYRKLNAVTTPDEFPLPRQSEILASLSGANVLSSLDALSGFTQLEMDEEHREKTAFRTHRGLFQFKRMPFGLRNGPAIFQRIMQGILSPYLWLFCLVYIDDIVVYSKSYEDHIEHLDKVLGLIEKSGITLSPTKCHLFYGSVLLLGHKVSRLGLSTHWEKVKAVMELERPNKLASLQTFLGMTVYFSAFIPYYADICAPLFALLRKGAKWSWGEEQELAWKKVKERLQQAPVLGHPIEGRPYRLYTDASDIALGCALQQIQPIKLKDLKGTKAYETVMKAHLRKEDPPKLPISLSTKVRDDREPMPTGQELSSQLKPDIQQQKGKLWPQKKG